MSGFARQLTLLSRKLKAQRLDLASVTEAFYSSTPDTRMRADRRRALMAALEAEQASGTLRLPSTGGKHWDTLGHPALPLFVTLICAKTNIAPLAEIDWLPELAFAATLPRGGKRTILATLNAFLIATPREHLQPLLTYRERALQIYLEEKTLDRYVTEDCVFGVLPLERLGAYNPKSARYSTLTHRTNSAGHGKPGIIIENEHTYESLVRWNTQAEVPRFSFVAFGSGTAIEARCAAVQKLAQSHNAVQLYYFGDLDPNGVAIATRFAEGLRQSAGDHEPIELRPELSCYAWLLQHGVRKELGSNKVQETATQWLGDLAIRASELFVQKHWVAQEAVTQSAFDQIFKETHLPRI